MRVARVERLPGVRDEALEVGLELVAQRGVVAGPLGRRRRERLEVAVEVGEALLEALRRRVGVEVVAAGPAVVGRGRRAAPRVEVRGLGGAPERPEPVEELVGHELVVARRRRRAGRGPAVEERGRRVAAAARAGRLRLVPGRAELPREEARVQQHVEVRPRPREPRGGRGRRAVLLPRYPRAEPVRGRVRLVAVGAVVAPLAAHGLGAPREGPQELADERPPEVDGVAVPRVARVVGRRRAPRRRRRRRVGGVEVRVRLGAHGREALEHRRRDDGLGRAAERRPPRRLRGRGRAPRVRALQRRVAKVGAHGPQTQQGVARVRGRDHGRAQRRAAARRVARPRRRRAARREAQEAKGRARRRREQAPHAGRGGARERERVAVRGAVARDGVERRAERVHGALRQIRGELVEPGQQGPVELLAGLAQGPLRRRAVPQQEVEGAPRGLAPRGDGAVVAARARRGRDRREGPPRRPLEQVEVGRRRGGGEGLARRRAAERAARDRARRGPLARERRTAERVGPEQAVAPEAVGHVVARRRRGVEVRAHGALAARAPRGPVGPGERDARAVAGPAAPRRRPARRRRAQRLEVVRRVVVVGAPRVVVVVGGARDDGARAPEPRRARVLVVGRGRRAPPAVAEQRRVAEAVRARRERGPDAVERRREHRVDAPELVLGAREGTRALREERARLDAPRERRRVGVAPVFVLRRRRAQEARALLGGDEVAPALAQQRQRDLDVGQGEAQRRRRRARRRPQGLDLRRGVGGGRRGCGHRR